ncbi:MAG: hypothetical protein CVV44_06150 [Spirochaetae bacterium HGW-Spirochaetae-1]|jgi:hypothetical protein|nr:MAG: hypothetical protein CVV44_06150 [Spirochaetae bacterium HGW-Spirochaetae-1]
MMISDILKKTGSMFFVIFLCAAVAEAQVKTAETDLAKSAIEVGESTTLTIRITSGTGDMKQVQVPRVSGLDITYSGMQRSFQFINGKTWQGVSLTYTVTGEKKGSYKIPPLVFEQDGAFIKSREVSLIVKNASGRTTSGGGGTVMPEVVLSKKKVYLGEPVLVRYYLLTSGGGSINIEAIEKQPEARGFMVNRIEENRGDDMASRDGNELIRSHLYTFALIPTQTGSLETGGGSVIMSAERRDGFFGMMDRKRIIFDTGSLEVLPLPEKGKPADFPGNVGTFTMKLDYDRETLKAFNEKRATITIEGEGSLYLVAKPLHEGGDRDVRVLVEEGEKDISVSGDTLKGKVTFTVTVIPEREGSVNAGRFIFPYFNPADKSYHTLKTGDILLEVKGGGKSGPHMGFDTDSSGSVDFNPLYIAIIVLLVVGSITGIVIWERRRYRIISRGETIKEEKPEQESDVLKSLERDLSASLFKKDSDLFFKTVDRILGHAAGLSPAVKKLKVPGDELDKIRDRLYATRFGGGTMSEADMKEISDSLKKSGIFS